MLYFADGPVALEILAIFVPGKAERIFVGWGRRVSGTLSVVVVLGLAELFLNFEVGGVDGGSDVEQFSEGVGHLGLEILIVLHPAEMVVEGGDDGMEFMLVGLLACIKFNNPPLQDLDEVEEQIVVGLLLLPGCEPRVYRHYYFYL